MQVMMVTRKAIIKIMMTNKITIIILPITIIMLPIILEMVMFSTKIIKVLTGVNNHEKDT